MLRTGPKRKIIFKASGLIYIIAGLMSSFTVWLMAVKSDDKWIQKKTVLWGIIESFQGIAFWVLCALAITVTCTAIVKQMADPWVVEKLQFILDEYQDKVFKNANAPLDHNRVTLFKFKKSLYFKRHWQEPTLPRWVPFKTRRFRGDYLVPYMRSGHLTLNTKTLFYIDSENSSKCQGVAGQSWSKGGVVVLPDLPKITDSSTESDKESYAKVTKSSVRLLDKYLKEGREPPRSIAAMTVECDGKLWGVIVLDSLDPLGVTTESVDHYSLTVALIGHLLERA
ncbi:GAF domain-containing protein [Pseudomonas citronellolis]|uniref:GAF domain-containing protein n=1 Tax=Pseudomonas citronellolis TaxID=53408 RepID=UPI002648AD38|nr:GAF domain-containing protein [Pseudomonas citronellolis]MDN6874215.1 GAF domain-containing protein [Pseudomonas citronellolis]